MERPGPSGMRITYIEGWKVIHDANQIFGFNGWSSRILSLDVRFVDEQRSRYNACVSATVRVTLRDGTMREDRGGGIAENMRSKGEAVLKAEKEAITDATKRALKNFGLRLGLSLYNRQHVREMNRPTSREPIKDPNHASHANHPPISATRTPVSNRSTAAAVAAAAAPRYSPKDPASSPLASSVQSFQKVQHSTTAAAVAAASAAAESSEIAIDRALAAKVAANREEAIMRQQVFRSRGNRPPQNPPAASSVSAFQNAQSLPSAARNNALTPGQYAAVANKFSVAGQRGSSPNAFPSNGSAGIVSNQTERSNGMATSGNGSRRTNQPLQMQNSGLSVAQFTDGKQHYMMGATGTSVTRNCGNMAQQNRSSGSRTTSAGSDQNVSVQLAVSLGLSSMGGRGVGGGRVGSAQDIPLQTGGPGSGSVKQNEIDELNAIALADF